MNHLATDSEGRVHLVRPDGEHWTSVCGIGTGPPEYTTDASDHQVSHLLATMGSGCTRCVRKTMFIQTGTGGRA